jgi:hypothetical protein
VAIAASITWARNRQPTSLQSGVESFRREMEALSPEGDPRNRRRVDPSTGRPPTAPRQGPPRRPTDADEES